MAQRRGQFAGPWVCGHIGACTHVGSGGRRARFSTICEPKPPLPPPVPAREYVLHRLSLRWRTFLISRARSAPMGYAWRGLQPRGGALSPPKKRATERFATDPATATTGATDGATVPLCVVIFGCALLRSLRDRSVLTRTQCMHTGIGPILPGGRAMHDLSGSMVLQQG
jgi:hypothetical protein